MFYARNGVFLTTLVGRLFLIVCVAAGSAAIGGAFVLAAQASA